MKNIVSLAVLFIFLVSIIPAFGGAQATVGAGRRARKAARDHAQKTADFWAQQKAELGVHKAAAGSGSTNKRTPGNVNQSGGTR